jgi:hypothetical protein
LQRTKLTHLPLQNVSITRSFNISTIYLTSFCLPTYFCSITLPMVSSLFLPTYYWRVNPLSIVVMTLRFPPSIQRSGCQNKQFDTFVVVAVHSLYCRISHTFMISDGIMQTLPCMNITRHLQSILEIYDLPGTTPGESFDWTHLSSIPIYQKDLSTLVRSIGFYLEGCLLTHKSKNSTKYPFSLCNTCRLFKGSFICSHYSHQRSL